MLCNEWCVVISIYYVSQKQYSWDCDVWHNRHLDLKIRVLTLSLSYFVALLCEVKSLIVRFILDLDYCAETDFLLSRIWVKFSVGNSENSANLREWSSDMYATFIQFENFHLSKYGASKKFVFMDCSVLTDSAFYFALPVLLCLMDFFVPLTFSSFVQCPEVLRMIVSPLNMLIFIVH